MTENRFPTTVEYLHIRKVQEQLYETLAKDKTRVAVLLGEHDVNVLIAALRGRADKYGTDSQGFADDLETLRRSVYGA